MDWGGGGVGEGELGDPRETEERGIADDGDDDEGGVKPLVTADNLNLDVLELIFAHLEGHNLVHLFLVSRNFLATTIPVLYRTINVNYDLSQSSKSSV